MRCVFLRFFFLLRYMIIAEKMRKGDDAENQFSIFVLPK